MEPVGGPQSNRGKGCGIYQGDPKVGRRREAKPADVLVEGLEVAAEAAFGRPLE